MIDFSLILNKAIAKNSDKPSSKEVVNALLEAEKNAHKTKHKYDFEQLIGSWNLCFITGTKKSRQKFANFMGEGFYLPLFINIKINYSINNNSNLSELSEKIGNVENTVNVGLVTFSLTGPIKFISKKNILAFDFNYLTLSILGKKIYSTDIRGGKSSEQNFYQENVKTQAFFSYFLITENFIAARGKGGGLALWRKV